jgi:methionyl-tRNA formyltransferase
MANVILMGTPEFAVPILEVLCAQHRVVLVVTQPDRKQGRGQQACFSPVKQAALERGLDIWQPETLRTPEAVQRLREAQADVYVTAAIGHILTAEVLDLPAHGCLNVHASLLPRWRGAAPVSAAILHGDAETGITLMCMDEGMDTGPILAQSRCAIRPDDTTETLARRLARLGADLLATTLPRWLAGEIDPRPQSQEGVTLCRRLHKEDGLVDWRQSAVAIERMIRAYTPWPGVHTTYRGQKLDILRACALLAWPEKELPGRVVARGTEVAVVTGQGVLLLQEIRLAGKRPMSPDAFCRGQRDFLGSNLGGSRT